MSRLLPAAQVPGSETAVGFTTVEPMVFGTAIVLLAPSMVGLSAAKFVQVVPLRLRKIS